MTVGDITPNKEKGSGRSKHVADEKAPLLPKQQDEDAVHDEFNGASFIGAVFNLSTTIVGAGIMALPATMKVLGLILGVALIIFMDFLTDASIEFLIRFSKAGKITSYGGLMGDAFGKYGKIMLQICGLVNNIGVLIVYMIIIGDVLSGTSSSGVHHAGVLEGWFGQHWWNGRTFVLLISTIGIFSPLACFKRIDSLRFSSALSVALAVAFLVIILAIAIFKLISGTVVMPRLLPDVTDLTSFWKLFTVFPVLVTAFICHYNVHNIANELKNTTQIGAVVRTSLASCSIVYIMTSVFGFLLFGDATLADVLANFDTDLGTIATYLMMLSVINIDGLFFPSASPLPQSTTRFAFITSGLLILIFLGANFIPSIWVAFQFTGATAAVCLGFIFPAAVTLRDRHVISRKEDRMLAIVMIVLSVFSNMVLVYGNAISLLKKNQ
ncbi:hypothetical protein E1A91_D12G061600v1 [Gossypium mustelinum]|uniref:Amino acid transporter transmembrane domain-containing protein n=1 Tax=Gossypium mustelinum TaxID=34275 RepID=A0A5D2SAB8_GOSMU|nr:hypothetical protein E1A91_D12G061600v1 [Gossypium mustelinum]